MVDHVTRFFKHLRNANALSRNPLSRHIIQTLSLACDADGVRALHHAIRNAADSLYAQDIRDERDSAVARRRYEIIVHGDLHSTPAKVLAGELKLSLRQFLRERLYCRRRIVELLLHGAYIGLALKDGKAPRLRFEAWCSAAEQFFNVGVRGDALVALSHAAQIASEIAADGEGTDIDDIQRRLFSLYDSAAQEPQ